MFIMIGITRGRKNIPYTYMYNCQMCHGATSVEVYVTYQVFSLFFIPLFKWHKQYYLVTRCCQSVYALDERAGRCLEKGMDIVIGDEDLTFIYRQTSA